MFAKILIANRGEIACRVANTAKKMGIATVAVYSDADQFAKHVAVCDEAFYIGGSAAKDSYLCQDKLIAIAKQSGAEAIHPGYGFLSENAQFAQACADVGLVFIGPPAQAISAMGLKAESKRLMEDANVPLIPGYHGTNQDPAFLHAEADKIGYPVLIKASSGGGGKGMRLVEQSADFLQALASCQREAMSSFGNDHVLIEKYALKPRHIEIQIFGDSHGNYVHLFERDCSVQRRHQKVLEEAPAPNVSEQMRRAMGEAAINAARAVGYVGAGTVEFIVEQRPEGMNFYFMEMNTRLQVEHPVTEAITGTDLVEWQLRVASGEPLPKTQAKLAITGHAIEARICAENPDNNFLPATGTLSVYRKPAHTAFAVSDVRIDDGVREHDVISPYYDSMIGKLIVHAPTRQQALLKLDQALAQMHIVGLPTNVAFLRRVLHTPSFSQVNLDTALIEREKDTLFNTQTPTSTTPWLIAAAIVKQLDNEQACHNSHDPFYRHKGFRAYGSYQRRFDFQYQEQAWQADLSLWTDNQFHLTIYAANAQNPSNNQASTTDTLLTTQVSYAIDPSTQAMTLWLDGQRQSVQVWQNKTQMTVFGTINGTLTLIDKLVTGNEDSQDHANLKSPMPGQILAILVKAGDSVSKGQPLAVIEAMKMEHTIFAPSDGTVTELLFKAGDLVSDGDELLKLETEAKK